VAEAMALKDGSSKAFEKIRLREDYRHNFNILALGEGGIVVRNPATKHPSNASSFLLCIDYLGFFKGDGLWGHNT